MAYSFFDARIIKIIDETPSVKRFYFKVEDPEAYTYKAGQFVMLDLPIESKVHTRSYSIASAPNNDKEFELIIVHKPGGLGTEFLWKNVGEGSLIKASKALGKFCLPEQIDRDLCFVATGTGIAPLRAMLYEILQTKALHHNIYLIFGNRYEQDILYRNELEKLENELSQFHFIPVLSRAEKWKGKKGYVHQVYQELFADKSPAYFYLCGWHQMLHDARENLEKLGYDKQFIKFESYD